MIRDTIKNSGWKIKLLLHIITPTALYIGYIIGTSIFRWHGVFSDSIAMLVIIVWQGIMIYCSKWPSSFSYWSSLPLGVLIFIVSIVLMLWFGFEVRTRYI